MVEISPPIEATHLEIPGRAPPETSLKAFEAPVSSNGTGALVNLLGKNYFEQLLPAAGNAGHYAAVLGDPRTYGVTLRYAL